MIMSCGAMDRLEMVDVCLKCYERQKCDQGSVERLRKDGCCNYAQHQWSRKPCDSVTTVIDGSGCLEKVRQLPHNALWFKGDFIECRNCPPCSPHCTYAHSDLELQAWNKRKKETLTYQWSPPSPPLIPPKLTRDLSRTTSYVGGRLTKMKHTRDYELLPESELDERLLKEPLTRDNYVDKFHTLLYYEEHEHARVLQERCDSKSLTLSLFQTHDYEMWGSLVGLRSNDVAYIQQAATYVDITASGTTVHAEISNYGVSNKGWDVVNVKFNDDYRFHALKSKITKRTPVSVNFILKHSYFRNLHKSLDKIYSETVKCLIPSSLQQDQGRLPYTPYPVENFLWLDKEYQLLALKKMMACDNSVPFLLTGPFGTGKTRVLATAAITFLKRHSHRVLICTSHLQSADAYIDSYFGPMVKNHTMPRNVNPVRLVGVDNYKYFGDYKNLFKSSRNPQQGNSIKHSRLIITTFLTAPQLINLKVKRFTHILIDEGAQTREPEAIAPLGLADDNTKIVIAGDHLQIGPQMLVLGDKVRESALGQSLLQRLHRLYHEKLPFDNPYTALLLTNYRCHDSILRLPSNLFFQSTLQVRAHSKLHPKTSSALEFICTSMDTSRKTSLEDISEEEAIITLEQVQLYVDPWPVAQWGYKDLSTICVMSSSRNQVRVIRKLLNQKKFRNIKGVQTLATYELQGREFRAIFISTLEVTKEDGSTLNPTKTICDKYVFNTVITRAQSLIVCVGNPFLLFSIEKHALNSREDEVPTYCWREYVKRCLETSSFRLHPQCYETDQSILQGNITTKLYEETFGDLQESLDSPCGNVETVTDSILEAYKRAFQSNKACQNVKVILGNLDNGDRAYVLQRDGTEKIADKSVPESTTKDDSPIECYLESINFRKSIATPSDPSQSPITINGIDNRRGALDGSLVQVVLYEDGDNCGQVCEVLKQGPQTQFVCSVDGNNSIFFCPIDRKNPKLVNLPGLSREMLKKASNDLIIKEELVYKQHAVTVFDPKSFTTPNKAATNGSVEFANIEVPQIKDVIPLSIAQKLLFVVSFLRWNPKYRYPLGVVIAAIPRGLTLYHAQRMLLAHHHINTASVDDVTSDDHDAPVATIDPSLPRYDHALTIDPPEAKMLDDALTLEPISSKDDGQCYQLGVHIANVGRVLNRAATEIDKIARERGTAVYGSKTNPLFYPMLPKQIRENLSLDCNKKALAISITCRVSITGKNIKIDTIKVHESCVCSRAQLTYKDVQELLNGTEIKNGSEMDNKVKKYNNTLPSGSTFRLAQKVAVLLQISEYFFKDRMQSDEIDYTIEDDEVFLSPQAYFLVKEMMIWTNRIAAEHVLAAFPESALLRRQQPPNQDRLTKAIEKFKDAIDFLPLYKSLSEKLKISGEPGPFLMMELLRKQLLGALQFGDTRQASNLLRVTSYHPQLAVLSREVNGSKSRAQYVCSGQFQEQEKLELQHGNYLVSLTDDQKKVYSHYDLCCLYTHFTSPLRRYIDIVVQRLILQSLSSSTTKCSLEDFKKVCDESNDKISGAKQFGKEFKRLSLALSFAECSQPCTAYVASVEKSLQLIIRELDCQFLSLDQRSFRLSSITSIAKRYNDPVPEKNSVTEENKYFVWKSKITSFNTSSYTVNGFTSVRKCASSFKLTRASDAMFTVYSPEQQSKSEANGSTSTEKEFSVLTQQCFAAEFSNKPLSLGAEEWAKVAGFMRQPSEDTAASLKELLMSYNPTKDGDGVKFPTNASFWLYEIKQSFEAYKCFKVSLAANFSDYILSPCIQLLEVAPMLNVCVQHSTNPASCFSTPILSHASRIQYNDITEYIDLWEKVLLAEAAVQSVSDCAEVQLIQNVPLKWPTLQQPSTSLDNIHYSPIEQSASTEKDVGVTLTITDKFIERCGEYFDIQVGNLVCARYNIPLNEEKEAEGRPVQTASAVYHFVIDSISDPDKNDDVTNKLRRKKLNKSENQPYKIVHLKIVSKEAARVSKFMKPYLENPKSLCEIQIIPLNLPYRRMYRSLLALRYTDVFCHQIALGKAFNKKIPVHSIYKKTTLVKKDPLVFALWPNPQNLNGEQSSSLLTAIKNKFQLIQGPPGTGKSVTGAHLAYAFIVASNPDLKFAPSNNDEKIKCVMYCGPSNKSVDVVLDMFLKHPKLKDLRILRIYSKSIETEYHYGPHSCKVYGKPRSDQKCKETHEQFALHEKIRSRECSLSPTILQMEEKFERYSEENKLPSPSENQKYNNAIKNAEEEIIRRGRYHIVFCTCNEACSVRVVDNIKPIHLIIDEAAMATEPEAMIPIQLADHVTLIGDHMQLQPVISHTPAKEKGLGYSLFQRYAKIHEKIQNGDVEFAMTPSTDSMLMLTTQYRMHDKICEFPSDEFYDGELKADPSVLRQFCSLEGFWPRGPQCPIAFCDIVGKEEGASSHHKAHQESKCNRIEAEKIVKVIVALRKAKRSNRREPKIAVLTPYKAQKELVEDLMSAKRLEVTVSTINESQGSEFDFVIFSTVRSMPRHTIRNRAAVQPDRTWIRDHLGFITDRHQICVGITRAKHGLVIVGNAMLLNYDVTWERLLRHYSSCGCKVAGSTFPLKQ